MRTPLEWQEGGRIEKSGKAAFRFLAAEHATSPVLVAVPHAGRSYPDSVRTMLRDPEPTAIQLEDRHVDRIAVRAAVNAGAAVLIAAAPRALIDLNRSPTDIDWSMVEGRPPDVPGSAPGRRARSGLGLVPRSIAGFGEIWRQPLQFEELTYRIENIHQPYHDTLSAILDKLRGRFGAATLIDLHSMPPLRRRGGGSASFVLGDRFGASCEAGLVSYMLRFFETQGQTVSLNSPYAGGYVLERHGKRKGWINAVQLEICRATYLDRKLDRVSPRLPMVADCVTRFVEHVGERTRSLSTDGFAIAAE
jgi:N-formylglutamate amidohydrolase